MYESWRVQTSTFQRDFSPYWYCLVVSKQQDLGDTSLCGAPGFLGYFQWNYTTNIDLCFTWGGGKEYPPSTVTGTHNTLWRYMSSNRRIILEIPFSALSRNWIYPTYWQSYSRKYSEPKFNWNHCWVSYFISDTS